MISVANAPHYSWGNGCDGWRLVQSDALSVIQERMPPGTAEVPHRHTRARQFFFVLDGTLSIAAPGTVHRLAAREGLEIAPGVGHRVFNNSAVDVQFIVVSSPPSADDRAACDEDLATTSPAAREEQRPEGEE